MAAPWISVITVVKDDPEGFVRTLDSVRSQSHRDFELIIVDGSGDRGQIPRLLGQTPAVYVWSEPTGIYPAMNEALYLASGEFAFFLNAGDYFRQTTVLTRSRERLEGRYWGFGPIEIIERGGAVVTTPSWDYPEELGRRFSRGHFPAHQGTFARRDLLVSFGGFDTSYVIAADYAMAMRLARHSDPALLPFTVATFREGGASTMNWEKSFREFHRARQEIWAPRGFAAVREYWDTSLHFLSVWFNRRVLSPLRGETQ